MVKRLTATKELLHMSVMGVQFMAGVRFLIGVFDSDETVRRLWEAVSGTYGEMGSVLSGPTYGPSSSGPPGALFLVLGFMCFGYVLFTAVPGAAARMEKGKSAFIDE